MTLKTFSRSISPFWRMLGFTLRKSLGIIIVLCAAALLYCPGSYISTVLDSMVGVNAISYTFIFAEFVAFFAGAVAVGFNIINFTFLYKKSAGDVFHAFPLTRCELLLSRALSGVISTMIPVTLVYGCFATLIAFNTWLGDLKMLALCFLNTLLIVLVCSAFSLIFVVCAGSMFDLAVSLAGVNLAVMLIGTIFTDTLSSTLIGFPDNYSFNMLYNLSVPYFCYRGIVDLYSITEIGINSAFIEFYIRAVIYIVAFNAAAILLYNYRKAEKGGTAYAYKFMYLICSMLVGICGGYIIGMMFGYGPEDLAYWAFMTIGALLCSTVYGVISNRGFKQVWRSVAVGGVAAAISIAVAVVGITGAFGYSERIPDADKISEVVVTVTDETVTLKEPQKALALHKDIVKSGTAQKNYYLGDRIAFDYKLKNGKIMSREFYLDINEVADTALDVYKSGERIDFYIQKIKDSKAQSITLDYSKSEGSGMILISNEQAIELLNAYKKDLAQCDKSVMTADYNDIYYLVIMPEDKDDTVYYNISVKIYDNFDNTNRYIADNIKEQ